MAALAVLFCVCVAHCGYNLTEARQEGWLLIEPPERGDTGSRPFRKVCPSTSLHDFVQSILGNLPDPTATIPENPLRQAERRTPKSIATAGSSQRRN